jgi:hypothetical protein
MVTAPLASCEALLRGADPAPQPVLVLLHTRFDDHFGDGGHVWTLRPAPFDLSLASN